MSEDNIEYAYRRAQLPRQSEDLAGNTYGELSVLYITRIRDIPMWVCKCRCGNHSVKRASDLKRSNHPSCGCKYYTKNRLRSTSVGKVSGTLLGRIKTSAAKRLLEMGVSDWDISKVLHDQNYKCALTGLPISAAAGEEITASLDRIDSSLGYIKGNIQWVHKHINVMKMAHDQDYFIELCTLVANQTGGSA